jgi:WD40 repeat protein
MTAAPGVRTVRVFVSSPGDIGVERERIDHVAHRLNEAFAGLVHIDTVRWETEFYSSRQHFQDKIPPPTACDLVIAVFWSRLGTPLPNDYRMANGERYPSGTAYELLTALEALGKGGRPDVLVFRKTEVPHDTSPDAIAQWKDLNDFFSRWFQAPDGRILHAYHRFKTSDEFEDLVDRLLRQWINEIVLQPAYPLDQTRREWEQVRGSTDPAVLEHFAEVHEGTSYADRARERARGLRDGAAPVERARQGSEEVSDNGGVAVQELSERKFNARAIADFVARARERIARWWALSTTVSLRRRNVAIAAAALLAFLPLILAFAAQFEVDRSSVALIDPSVKGAARAHESEVTAIAFGSGLVITSSYDGTVKLWDASTSALQRTLTVVPPPPEAANPPASPAQEAQYVRDVAPLAVAQTADGRVVAMTRVSTASDDGNGHLSLTCPLCGLSLHDLATQGASMPDADPYKGVATANSTPHAIARNWIPINSGTMPYVVLAVPGASDTYAVGTANGQIAMEMEASATPSRIEPPAGSPQHKGAVTALAVTKDGKLASVSDDGSAILWSLQGGRFTSGRSLPASDCGPCTSAAFSEDGKRLITAGGSRVFQVWNADTGELVGQLQEADAVNVARLTQDGKIAITAGDDGAAHLWDVATGAPLAVIRGHGDAIVQAELTPDGTRLVTAARDGSVRVTSLAMAQRLDRFDLAGLFRGHVAPPAAVLLGSLRQRLAAIAPRNNPAASRVSRVALVIGNSNYAQVTPLPNPVNDARAIAALLESLGFDVITELDIGRADFISALKAFQAKAQGADIAAVYYSGHGLEYSGSNYLIPVDAKPSSAIDIEFELVPLDMVLSAAEGARMLRLILLDACRDNPFVPLASPGNTRSVALASPPDGAITRAISRGLARIEVTPDTLVGYAAAPGSVALDGSGDHSPYAAALLKYLGTPGADIRIVLGQVRDEVTKMTMGRQQPFVYGSLGGRITTLVPAPQLQGSASPQSSPK